MVKLCSIYVVQILRPNTFFYSPLLSTLRQLDRELDICSRYFTAGNESLIDDPNAYNCFSVFKMDRYCPFLCVQKQCSTIFK